MKDFKMDKTFSKAQTFKEAESNKKFNKDMPVGERLREAWWLTCMTYGIDPENPPKLDKHFFHTRKHGC